jgi:hypothetical protein
MSFLVSSALGQHTFDPRSLLRHEAWATVEASHRASARLMGSPIRCKAVRFNRRQRGHRGMIRAVIVKWDRRELLAKSSVTKKSIGLSNGS